MGVAIYIYISTNGRGRRCPEILKPHTQLIAFILTFPIVFRLVLSQFPPSLTEMLVLVGTGRADLNHMSILEGERKNSITVIIEKHSLTSPPPPPSFIHTSLVCADQIVPDKVWVLEVFLTRKQKELALHQRPDLSAFQDCYKALSSNPQLSSSSLHCRVQSSVSTATSKDVGKNSSNENESKPSPSQISSSPPLPSISSTPYASSRLASKSFRSCMKPVSSNAQQKKRSISTDTASLLSEDAVMVSPGMASVSFDNEHIKIKRMAEAYRFQKSKNRLQSTQDMTCDKGTVDFSSKNASLNETDELYQDAIDVDPEMALGPEILCFFSSNSQTGSKEGRGEENTRMTMEGKETRFDGSVVKNDNVIGVLGFSQPTIEVAESVCRTGSTSSEGFATPSPTPPKHSSVIAIPGHPRDESSGPDVNCSFKTANESFMYATGEDGGEEGSKGDRVSRTDSKLPEQNTLVSCSFPPSSSRLAVGTSGTPTMRRSSTRSRSMPKEPRTSDSDEDFMDPLDIDRLVHTLVPQSSFTNAETGHGPRIVSKSSSPPPVPLHRGRPSTITTSTSTSHASSVVTGITDEEEVPPTPPPHATSQRAPISTENSQQDYFFLTPTSPEDHSLPGSRKFKKMEVEGEEDEQGPPVPPRQVSAQRAMLSGRLYSPEQFSHLLEMNSADYETGEKCPASMGNDEVTPQSSWIHSKVPESLEQEGGEGFVTSETDADAVEVYVTSETDAGADTVDGYVTSETDASADIVEELNGLDLSDHFPAVRTLESNEKVSALNQGEGEADVSTGSPVHARDCRDIKCDVNYEDVEETVRYKTLMQDLPNTGMEVRELIPESESCETVVESDINNRKRVEGVEAESEPSEAAIEVDSLAGDSESKTSSITVTLDLSHIAKDDIIYKSGYENAMSSCSGSVDISQISSALMDTNNESSEEAGTEGMETPVDAMETTYNESIFNPVKEKQRDSTGTDEEAGSAAKEVVRDDTREFQFYHDCDDDDDERSNDSAEYSSLPDEDDGLRPTAALSPLLSAEMQKSKTWLTQSLDRPNMVCLCVLLSGRGRYEC